MSFFKKIQQLIKMVDLFFSTEKLRYNKEPKYKTITGGVISIILIISIMIAFGTMIQSVFNKNTITSSFQLNRAQTPPIRQFTTGKDYFNFGIYIQPQYIPLNLDLNKGPQFFEVKVHYGEAIYGRGKSFQQQQQLQIEPCTREHVKQHEPTYKNFDNLQAGNGKCLKLNNTYGVGGIFGASLFKYFQVRVWMCRNTTKNKNHCAPQQQIDQMFENHTNFYMYATFLNPIINPNKQDFIKYFLSTTNYVVFSKTMGQDSKIQISDFIIKTDTSILPFQEFVEQKGFIVENQAISHTVGIVNYQKDSLADIKMYSSGNTLIYQRQFLKISAVLSYIGGLISAVILALVLFKFYNECSLQIDISLDLFNQNENQQLSFNFFKYVFLLFYYVLQLCGKEKYLTQTQNLSKYREQILEQLDVKLLIKRIINIEDFLSKIVTVDEIKKMRQPITLERAKELRILFNGKSDTQLQNFENQRSNNRLMFELFQYITNKGQPNFKIMDNYIKDKNSYPPNGLQIILNSENQLKGEI